MRQSGPEVSTRSFRRGSHVITVSKVSDDRWRAAVDGSPSAHAYASSADALEDGVHEVDRLDSCELSPSR